MRFGVVEAPAHLYRPVAISVRKALHRQQRRAALLQLPAGAPLLSVERLSHTYGDRPVEVRRGLYNTESHFYRNELS